jgi:pilus assembly protein CpaE
MNKEIQTLVALDGEVDRGLIEALIASDPQINVIDYLELGGPTASGLGTGDALIVAVADYTTEVSEFVVTARRQHASRPIVLVCPLGAGAYVGEALTDGVDDIVALPSDPGAPIDPTTRRQLVFSLEKALLRIRGESDQPDGAKRGVIAVLGMKGGSGKTLTTTNLAVSLAELGRSVVIVDLDLQFGDVGLALGMSPERTMYDLVKSGGSLDASKLEDFLVEHESGVKTLLAPVRPDQASMITVPFLAEVQRLLADMFEFVVIDTPPAFSAEVISAVDAASDVLVVAMRDTLSLKNARLGLETLERMEFDRRRVKVLLNRANTNVGIEREDVLAILGRTVDVLIPSSRDITRSVNQGTPIAMQHGSEPAKAFRALAELYVDSRRAPQEEAAAAPLRKVRRSLLRRTPRMA